MLAGNAKRLKELTARCNRYCERSNRRSDTAFTAMTKSDTANEQNDGNENNAIKELNDQNENESTHIYSIVIC